LHGISSSKARGKTWGWGHAGRRNSSRETSFKRELEGPVSQLINGKPCEEKRRPRRKKDYERLLRSLEVKREGGGSKRKRGSMSPDRGVAAIENETKSPPLAAPMKGRI